MDRLSLHRYKQRMNPIVPVVVLILAFCTGCATTSSSDSKNGLTFHASFDEKLDADFAAGDPVLYAAEPLPNPGLPSSGVTHEKTGGKKGGFLRFTKKQKPVSFYKGIKN